MFFYVFSVLPSKLHLHSSLTKLWKIKLLFHQNICLMQKEFCTTYFSTQLRYLLFLKKPPIFTPLKIGRLWHPQNFIMSPTPSIWAIFTATTSWLPYHQLHSIASRGRRHHGGFTHSDWYRPRCSNAGKPEFESYHMACDTMGMFRVSDSSTIKEKVCGRGHGGAHLHNINAWEAETRDPLWVWDQPGLHQKSRSARSNKKGEGQFVGGNQIQKNS